jgi:GDPmannose 4,6-dehydratase
MRVMADLKPDEVYNLGAQSHVSVSFESPEYTAEVNGVGALRLLESIRILGLASKTRYYQASTSELFGESTETPQTEKTPFSPRSPYAIAKLFAYWTAVNYRNSYQIFACNGILFNHESPRRGETFVTRKITRALSRIAMGVENCVYLGNLGALRDWGHARDYVRMQWMMLQQPKPDDFVIASGEQHSIRDFIIECCRNLGVEMQFEGSGLGEFGTVVKLSNKELTPGMNPGQVIIRVDPRYFRPAEVNSLLGDATRAKTALGWKPATSFKELVAEMMEHDLLEARESVRRI